METAIQRALMILNGYFYHNFSVDELKIINRELNLILDCGELTILQNDMKLSYEELQEKLLTLNEKEVNRKDKGVYYTSIDLVEFILINCLKLISGKLKPNGVHVLDLNGIPYKKFCYELVVFDPTCGTGAFTNKALELKLDLLDLHQKSITKNQLLKVIRTVRGNDLNETSTTLSKIRMFLCVLSRYGVDVIGGISEAINDCFDNYDFVSNAEYDCRDYDIIVGNPPYVEDSKSLSKPSIKFGNIYANVLDNATRKLKPNGVIGFVIPLSYTSTPRMKGIRDILINKLPIQYILNYADRPDCLFPSVHQKLCIVFGKNKMSEEEIYTSGYRYWYKEERKDLFTSTEVVRNKFAQQEFIPKLGNMLDTSIYKKIIRNKSELYYHLSGNTVEIHLNMRATFWIKCFLKGRNRGSEYKTFYCDDSAEAALCMCILNSSLFWWYWTCVSDCWHITRKELAGFKIPVQRDYSQPLMLAAELEDLLEKTKVYVGTKQTDYEYKHKECIRVIHKIDDYVCDIFGLSEEEKVYIKNYAYRYRSGGGA